MTGIKIAEDNKEQDTISSKMNIGVKCKGFDERGDYRDDGKETRALEYKFTCVCSC